MEDMKKIKGFTLDEKSAEMLVELIKEKEDVEEIDDPEIEEKFPGVKVVKIKTYAVDLIVPSYVSGFVDGQVDACKLIRNVSQELIDLSKKVGCFNEDQIGALESLIKCIKSTLKDMKSDKKGVKKQIKAEQPLLAEIIKRFKNGSLLGNEEEEAKDGEESQEEKGKGPEMDKEFEDLLKTDSLRCDTVNPSSEKEDQKTSEKTKAIALHSMGQFYGNLFLIKALSMIEDLSPETKETLKTIEQAAERHKELVAKSLSIFDPDLLSLIHEIEADQDLDPGKELAS